MATTVLTSTGSTVNASGEKGITVSYTEFQSQDSEPLGGRQSTADSLLNINEHSVKGMPAYPIIIARGKGEFLWDADGKQYIDFNVGFSACNQGHCHPKIVSVMMAQCRTLTMPSRSVSNAQYQQFSRKLSQVTGFDKMMECNGGAEALDAAIKVARAWGRRVKGIEKDKAIAFTVDP